MRLISIIIISICLVILITVFWGCSNKENSDRVVIDDPDSPRFRSLPSKILNNDGTVICDRYFGDPETSLFILPYLPDKRIDLIQGYCDSDGSHYDRFAIDFAIPFLDTIAPIL